MRGRHDSQATILAFLDLEERVPQDHPIRTIKIIAGEALERLSPECDQMYSKMGRASVPPERLLKASLLISLYSVRSERAFCEKLEYNLLFRWFLDMNLMERSFDPTVFTKNRRRLLEHRIGTVRQVVVVADRQGLLSDEHFSVDGTLIEAAASLCVAPLNGWWPIGTRVGAGAKPMRAMHPALAGQGPSTASQTAWGLLALMAAGDWEHEAVRRGLEYLTATQLEDGTWDEPWFTGTGFPGYGVGQRARNVRRQGMELSAGFMIKYHLYSNYWPLMALGRFHRYFDKGSARR